MKKEFKVEVKNPVTDKEVLWDRWFSLGHPRIIIDPRIIIEDSHVDDIYMLLPDYCLALISEGLSIDDADGGEPDWNSMIINEDTGEVSFKYEVWSPYIDDEPRDKYYEECEDMIFNLKGYFEFDEDEDDGYSTLICRISEVEFSVPSEIKHLLRKDKLKTV